MVCSLQLSPPLDYASNLVPMEIAPPLWNPSFDPPALVDTVEI